MKKELDNLEFDDWYIKQSRAVSPEELDTLGSKLIEFMHRKSFGGGCTTHFFKHGTKDGSNGFFYFDSPMSERLAHYLIGKEMVRYAGKRSFHGRKYKSWTFQKDNVVSEKLLEIREEIKAVLTSTQQRKEIIKKATIGYLNRHGDMYLRWLFNNLRFEILAGGTEDFVVTEVNKTFILVENVCLEFIEAINELQKEDMLKINSNGYVLPGKKFKFTMWGKDGNKDSISPFVFQEEKILQPNLH